MEPNQTLWGPIGVCNVIDLAVVCIFPMTIQKTWNKKDVNPAYNGQLPSNLLIYV